MCDLVILAIFVIKNNYNAMGKRVTLKNTIKLKNTNNWQATGSFESKREFVKMLLSSGFLLFDEKKTLKNMYVDGAIIKAVDIDRKGNKGNFLISSDDIDKRLTHFALDRITDKSWLLEFIYNIK